MSMIKRQIAQFMKENVSFIGEFVVDFMDYQFEDTGDSIKVTGKMGDTEAFTLEVTDDTAIEWLGRLLSKMGMNYDVFTK